MGPPGESENPDEMEPVTAWKSAELQESCSNAVRQVSRTIWKKVKRSSPSSSSLLEVSALWGKQGREIYLWGFCVLVLLVEKSDGGPRESQKHRSLSTPNSSVRRLGSRKTKLPVSHHSRPLTEVLWGSSE